MIEDQQQEKYSTTVQVSNHCIEDDWHKTLNICQQLDTYKRFFSINSYEKLVRVPYWAIAERGEMETARK